MAPKTAEDAAAQTTKVPVSKHLRVAAAHFHLKATLASSCVRRRFWRCANPSLRCLRSRDGRNTGEGRNPLHRVWGRLSRRGYMELASSSGDSESDVQEKHDESYLSRIDSALPEEPWHLYRHTIAPFLDSDIDPSNKVERTGNTPSPSHGDTASSVHESIYLLDDDAASRIFKWENYYTQQSSSLLLVNDFELLPA
ncbi:hypothetical protein S40285_10569 [Stachybotrys chlorohalonatus IBT 40285]|uniref:Uncharacterized protein n=1 Tax=Stachybotrys chlorohalonatus (strain IBT 40285) TaxID=1283841 RepID=A0A084QFB5_STAC4|nr:hypothetical protein S40285_10569 [Stachybotrys chlorohalonata IBT 40285]